MDNPLPSGFDSFKKAAQSIAGEPFTNQLLSADLFGKSTNPLTASFAQAVLGDMQREKVLGSDLYGKFENPFLDHLDAFSQAGLGSAYTEKLIGADTIAKLENPFFHGMDSFAKIALISDHSEKILGHDMVGKFENPFLKQMDAFSQFGLGNAYTENLVGPDTIGKLENPLFHGMDSFNKIALTSDYTGELLGHDMIGKFDNPYIAELEQLKKIIAGADRVIAPDEIESVSNPSVDPIGVVDGFAILHEVEIQFGLAPDQLEIAPRLASYFSLHGLMETGVKNLEDAVKNIEQQLTKDAGRAPDAMQIMLKAIKRRLSLCADKLLSSGQTPVSVLLELSPRAASVLHELWQLPKELRALANLLDNLLSDLK
jgi:hypothetical protein